MRIGAVALIALVAFVIGFGGAWSWRSSRCDAAKVAPLVQTIERHDEKAAAGNQAEQKVEKAEARQAAHTRKLTQEVRIHAQANPLPAECGLDPFRLYRWRAANRGAPVAPPGAPDDAAGGRAAAAGEQLAGGSDGEPYRSGRDIPQAPGALQRPGGLAQGNGSDAK